jgi:glycerophosphoryl diester phosphodiesterase
MQFRRFPYLDHPGPLAFAHRGGTEAAPENTMAAFEHAVGLGYRYLETDARATADGVLVAFHDDTLDRLSDRPGRISDLPWSEIASVRLAGGHAIPRLEDLLTAWPDVRINIDPKSDRAAALLPDLLARTGTVDRVCVGSFSDARTARIRAALGPALCTSMGPNAVARLRFRSWGIPVRTEFPEAAVQVSTHWRGVRVVDRSFVGTAHRLGLQVHVWTINDPAEMHRLLDLGVDGLMTDRPAVLKKVLEDRRSWAGRGC